MRDVEEAILAAELRKEILQEVAKLKRSTAKLWDTLYECGYDLPRKEAFPSSTGDQDDSDTR